MLYDWATLFAWKYKEYLASDYYIDEAFEAYISFYISLIFWAIYLSLWPITIPATFFILLLTW
jgi:hypothetical protein